MSETTYLCVVSMLSCPRIIATVSMPTPDCIIFIAQVCLKVCGVTRFDERDSMFLEAKDARRPILCATPDLVMGEPFLLLNRKSPFERLSFCMYCLTSFAVDSQIAVLLPFRPFPWKRTEAVSLVWIPLKSQMRSPTNSETLQPVL